MNILVTGSNSFLGKYLKEFSNLANDMIFLTNSKKVENQIYCNTLYSDISKKFKFQKIDSIIHIASIIPPTFEKSNFELFSKNIKMINNLYEFSLKKKVKTFIYISGFGSMLNPKVLDIKDFYTMSKIVGEHYCSMMSSKNIRTISLRISAPFGEFLKKNNVVKKFVDRALKNKDIIIYGSGQRKQNFTYAGDIVHAIELVLKDEVDGMYEVVSKNSISMINLAKLIISITKSKSKVIYNKKIDPQENYRPKYDYHRAFKDFGYNPKYGLIKGLRKYIEWRLK